MHVLNFAILNPKPLVKNSTNDEGKEEKRMPPLCVGSGFEGVTIAMVIASLPHATRLGLSSSLSKWLYAAFSF